MAPPSDDDPFPAAGSPGAPGAAPPPAPATAIAIVDARLIGRVVAGLLRATATSEPALVERANAALLRLGRPPLGAPDFASATPEELAPAIPPELRPAVAELLLDLAGEEPIRRRLADAYLGLWGLTARPAPPGRRGGSLLRWLIGPLPSHHNTVHTKDQAMDLGPYRGGEAVVAGSPAVARSPLRQRVEQIREQFQAVVAAVEQVIIGKREVVERMLAAMAARGHVLIVDVPGVGKTQLCKAIAAAVDCRFGRIQFTPDLLPLDLTGANVYDVRDKQFHFRPGPLFAHLLLADEINRATPKTQSALLEVMEERSVTVDGTTHRLAEPFLVLATMNPLDHQGTFALPAAQIDRFLVMLELGYPSPEDEVQILDRHLAAEPPLGRVTPVMDRAAFLLWQETVPAIHVSPEIKRTAVDYANALRRETDEGQQVSPRATLGWVRLAQARAMVAGREFVTLDDLHEAAPDVLRHRLWLDGGQVRERLRAIAERATIDTLTRPLPRPAGGPR